MHRFLCLALTVCTLGACSKTPTEPSSTGGGSRLLLGQAVSALDGTAGSGVAVQIGTRRSVVTDPEGLFAVDVGTQGAYEATLRSSEIVERQTTVFGPTPERARLTFIPAGFDLAAFDEMFRASHGRLQRWTSRPSLVVLGSVMVYRNGGGSEFEAGEEQLTEEEVSQMTAHLSEGLALLTGDVYGSFGSVTVERPAPGRRVNVGRDGSIVVGRYRGIETLANTIGYGQWAELPNGTITGGSMFLDRDFDRQDARRRLLRIHELGHALGYRHVESRTSIMNPAIGPAPTVFDAAAARIAFQRPPGNRSPDADPRGSSSAFSVSTGGGQWMPPVFCR